MKLRLAIYSLVSLACLLGSAVVAIPIYPLPQYYLTETAGGVVTDIPSATVRQGGGAQWLVDPPPDHHFIMAPAAYPWIYMPDPDVPGMYNSIFCINIVGAAVSWTKSPVVFPDYWTVSSSGVLELWSNLTGEPVANVLVYDSPNAVPDSGSTLILLATALFGLGAVASCRRPRPSGS